MIDSVGTVSIFVRDQDRAKAFYTDVLGFELRADAPLYPGAEVRWVSVAPRDGRTEVVLFVADASWSHYAGVVGQPQALTFTVRSMDEAVAALRAHDVTFAQEPADETWGTYAVILDSEGNQLMLVAPADAPVLGEAA